MLFLTAEELLSLTGLKRAKGQLTWLQQHGFVATLNAAGDVIVLRDHVRRVLGGGEEVEQLKRTPTEPDWSALERTA
ncbi:MAG: DUF4224 domain-containing protein [Gammaproteobacteria bacterium]